MNEKILRLHKIRTKIAMIQYLIRYGQINYDSILVHDSKFMHADDVIDSLVSERDSLEDELKELGVIE